MTQSIIPLRVEVVSLTLPPFVLERVSTGREPFRLSVQFAEIDISARFDQAMKAVDQPFKQPTE